MMLYVPGVLVFVMLIPVALDAPAGIVIDVGSNRTVGELELGVIWADKLIDPEKLFLLVSARGRVKFVH